MTFNRITIDPAVCTGKPCIRALRFPAARLLGLLAAGETREAILKAYPCLESGDIDEALPYAAFLAEDEGMAILEGPSYRKIAARTGETKLISKEQKGNSLRAVRNIRQ